MLRSTRPPNSGYALNVLNANCRCQRKEADLPSAILCVRCLHVRISSQGRGEGGALQSSLAVKTLSNARPVNAERIRADRPAHHGPPITTRVVDRTPQTVSPQTEKKKKQVRKKWNFWTEKMSARQLRKLRRAREGDGIPPSAPRPEPDGRAEDDEAWPPPRRTPPGGGLGGRARGARDPP